jgi:hypothetical protein
MVGRHGRTVLVFAIWSARRRRKDGHTESEIETMVVTIGPMV